VFLIMANKPKKRYNRQRSDNKPYTLDKPVLRDIRNYPIRRQQQVLLFLVHHRIPLERNIYSEYVNVPGRKLTGMDPVEEEDYKRPTTEEARKYFKIKNRSRYNKQLVITKKSDFWWQYA
jgi:hypothetical protein